MSESRVLTDENGIATFSWTPGPRMNHTLRISHPGIPEITVAALSRPAIATAGIVNAASFVPGLTPGGIATIFGSSLGANLAGTRVVVNGQAAQVFYASPQQVNFAVPAATEAGKNAEESSKTRLEL